MSRGDRWLADPMDAIVVRLAADADRGDIPIQPFSRDG
jgi:hypothetical protein